MYRLYENECIHKKNKIAPVLSMIILLELKDVNLHIILKRIFILSGTK